MHIKTVHNAYNQQTPHLQLLCLNCSRDQLPQIHPANNQRRLKETQER